jgi:REP element-mobilizing transposase RayT
MGHTYASVHLHVVFSTRERQRVIGAQLRQRLYEYMAGVARKEFGRAIVVGGTDDHVHGLLSVSTDISIGEAMSKWKSLSSGWVHKTFPAMTNFGWQTGYGVFSVSLSRVDKVTQYIEDQVEHHRRYTFQEELAALLKRHGIAYDAAHLMA